MGDIPRINSDPVINAIRPRHGAAFIQQKRSRRRVRLQSFLRLPHAIAILRRHRGQGGSRMPDRPCSFVSSAIRRRQWGHPVPRNNSNTPSPRAVAADQENIS
jgi:hypothetical protein